MNSERFRPYASVHTLLLRDGKIFMLRRKDSWKNNYWGVPAGHIEGEEKMTVAAARETKEEAGVDVVPEDMKFVHIVHRIMFGDREYVDVYFVAEKWSGDPHNAEAHKASEAAWFPIDELPEDTIETIRAAVRKYRVGIQYSEYGWNGEP
jgi:8-oxo-dGTP diphosphatase